MMTTAYGFIGYDCTGRGLNVTSLSLIDIGECDIDGIEPIKEEKYIQLMQLSDYDKVLVTTCKIEIDRTIYYCGMHSHVSIVQNGRKVYLQEVGEQGCKKLHEYGSIKIGNTIVDRIQQNQSNFRSIHLAGSATPDGKCSGTQYSDGFGTWDNVVVQATVKIALRKFFTPLKRTSEMIILPSGTHCPANSGNCMDSDDGECFWIPQQDDSCHFSRYDILYEGMATRLTPREDLNQTGPVIYTVTTQDTTFALARTREINICGYKLFHTEHPKLLVLETQKSDVFKVRAKLSVDNLDIFSYVNSKFIYVEKHVKTQLSRLYRDIMEQKCALERQILQNALSLASIAPDEMASRIMKAPGYTAVTAGEVIHLIKCVPVECKIRHTELCYQELPITYQNRSLYLLPRSRIITRSGTVRDCNELLPSMYKIHDSWFKIEQRPRESLPPPIIQPLTHPKWKYVSPSNLATSGIYTSDDLDRLRDHIMFPVEKPAMLNTIAQGAMGHSIPTGSISLANLLDEASLDKITENAWKKLWSGFMNFGSASAGVLGIIILLRVGKLIVDTIIHGYAIYSIYGWSIHLLGSIWTSMTNLLLHLGTPRKETKINEATEEELKPIESAPEKEDNSAHKMNIANESNNVNDANITHYPNIKDYVHENVP